jgi:hypothetical protein
MIQEEQESQFINQAEIANQLNDDYDPDDDDDSF